MQQSKRILIVYYSLGGNTARVARDLALRLGADLEQIHEQVERRGIFKYVRAVLDSVRERPVRLRDIVKRPADYDLTIVGTPVWAGRVTPAIRTYLQTVGGQIGQFAFFITSGATEAARVADTMEGLAYRQVIASLAVTERDLGNAAAYDGKLSAFLAALRSTPAVQAVARELANAHA